MISKIIGIKTKDNVLIRGPVACALLDGDYHYWCDGHEFLDSEVAGFEFEYDHEFE